MNVRVVSFGGEIEEVQYATGDVVVLAALRPGRAVLVTTADTIPTNATHWVNGGQLVEYTEAQATAKAQRPAHPARWCNQSMAWLDTRTAADLEASARGVRDSLLASCDWVVAKAIERAEPVPAPWAAYRQALRDLPSGPGWPTTHILPAPPA
jgi:hypothetical protein